MSKFNNVYMGGELFHFPDGTKSGGVIVEIGGLIYIGALHSEHVGVPTIVLDTTDVVAMVVALAYNLSEGDRADICEALELGQPVDSEDPLKSLTDNDLVILRDVVNDKRTAYLLNGSDASASVMLRIWERLVKIETARYKKENA